MGMELLENEREIECFSEFEYADISKWSRFSLWCYLKYLIRIVESWNKHRQHVFGTYNRCCYSNSQQQSDDTGL